MKLILAITTAMLVSTEAFVAPSRFGAKSSTALNLERGDSAGAIEAAMAASRDFGATSKEARIAWEIVEEINASDNSVAYEAKDVDESKNKETYDAFVELRKLGELQKDHVESIKHVTEQIRAVKISPPVNWLDERVHNPLFDTALAEAKDLTKKHGVHSPEAKLAWETLEDIASNDMSQVMKGAIDADEECLVEMMEACEAMEELNNALFMKEKA